jgi:hypothetical protein
MWARGKKVPFEIRPILKCQRMAATQLLKRKFGVTPSKGQWEWVDQEWQAWLSVLGKAPMEASGIIPDNAHISCLRYHRIGSSLYRACPLEPILRHDERGSLCGWMLTVVFLCQNALGTNQGESDALACPHGGAHRG